MLSMPVLLECMLVVEALVTCAAGKGVLAGSSAGAGERRAGEAQASSVYLERGGHGGRRHTGKLVIQGQKQVVRWWLTHGCDI